MNYNRSFIYLLWKDSNSNEKSKKLKGIQIPETVVIQKNNEYFDKKPFKIDWFFHSGKSGSIMKRHAANVNMISLQNFFLKRKGADPNYQMQLINEQDFQEF